MPQTTHECICVFNVSVQKTPTNCDRVFATDGRGDVVAFDANTGAEIWRVKPGGPLRGSPTIGADQLYVLSQDNQLFALSTADGSQKWAASGSLESPGENGVAAPAVASRTIDA